MNDKTNWVKDMGYPRNELMEPVISRVLRYVDRFDGEKRAKITKEFRMALMELDGNIRYKIGQNVSSLLYLLRYSPDYLKELLKEMYKEKDRC